MTEINRKEFLRLLSALAAVEAIRPLGAFAGVEGNAAWADYKDTTSWDPFVPNITDVDTYLRRKFRQDVTDKATGLDTAGMRKLLGEIVAAGKASGESWRITKAKCFAAHTTRMAIDVSPLDWFPSIAVWNRWERPITEAYWQRANEIDRKVIPPEVFKDWQDGNETGDWNIWQDFDHSVPDWRVILKLGFPGLKARLEKYAGARNAAGGYDDPFYEGLRVAIDGVFAGLDRFIAQGEKNLKGEIAVAGGRERLEKEVASLKRLRAGIPETAYDLLMFIWLYFFFSEHMDGIQCRSLTEIDVFLEPYYKADLAAGRTTEAELREQLKHWLWQWGSIANYWNQPVGLGGTRKDGTSAFNPVSKIFLEVADACALTTPKILVKVAPNTPDWAMDQMMDMARRHRSISFVGEEPCAKMLKKWAKATDEECRTMVLKGCYEVGLKDGANSSGAGHVNFLKPIERMLDDAAKGKLPALPDSAAFEGEYLRRLTDVTVRCRKICECTEKALPDVNPADLMTLATEHALKTRRDGYANGCPRGNNSTILGVGIGTAVDAILAVKEIVYEKKLMTLAELGRVMAANWAGHDELRLRMLRSKRKWGNNDPEANALGGRLIRAYGAQVNGFPNARGGVFLASGHVARQFIDLGSKTGATPDGRKAGEEMSKNLSPTMGADTEGATALVMTYANSGTTLCDLPGDYPLDLMLHPSACDGARGLETMKTLVRLFHANGGSVIQFTVFSAEELRDAQRHPEKYENLQVRVCGWNVRWNDMCKAEQDAYIRRAESIAR